eukprot:3754396-Pyramimonas_sp.AAC.1
MRPRMSAFAAAKSDMQSRMSDFAAAKSDTRLRASDFAAAKADIKSCIWAFSGTQNTALHHWRFERAQAQSHNRTRTGAPRLRAALL